MARAEPCPKCRGAMQEGYLLDNTYGTRKATSWIEGAPKASIWTGLNLRGRRAIRVASYRCDRCGYLESFARA